MPARLAAVLHMRQQHAVANPVARLMYRAPVHLGELAPAAAVGRILHTEEAVLAEPGQDMVTLLHLLDAAALDLAAVAAAVVATGPHQIIPLALAAPARRVCAS